MSTDLEKRKQSLIQKRLKAFVHAAPGIVHNLSNPLTIISTRSQLLQMKMPENQDFQKMVEQSKLVESQLNNIVFISQNMIDETHKLIDINELLKNEIEFHKANPFFKHKITKHLNFYPEPLTLRSSYFHIAALISAIIELSIRYLKNSPEPEIQFSTGKDDDSVTIIISTLIHEESQNISQLLNEHEPETPKNPAMRYLSDAIQIVEEVNINTTVDQTDEYIVFRIEIPVK